MNFILQILKLFAMMVFVRLSTLNALKVNITRMLTNEVLIKSDKEREKNTKESPKKALTTEKELNKLDSTQNIIEEKKTVITNQIPQTEDVSPKNCFKISSNSPEKINLKKIKSQLYISKLDIRNNSSLQIIVNDNENIFSPTSPGQHNNSQLCISNLDLSNNSTFQVIINNNDAGYFQIVFKILKDYCRCIQEIVFKILDESIQLGIYLKQSLYTIWDASKFYLANNAVQDPCKIGKEYGDELSELLAKIVNIESAAKKIDQISVDIKQIKENFSQIINIKSDIEDFKSEMLSFLNISSTPNISFASPLKRPPPPIPPPPPPPPPMPSLLPPPPPPPLPPTSLLTNSNIPIKIKKTNGQKKDKSLPVISLEDILSVKLKKTSKRRTQSSNERPLDPTVPIEILKQVKLKPTKLEIESQESPFFDETSTNQHSSLQKILKDEISTGTRFTRIRRIGRLNSNSVYRRKTNERREWEC